MKISLANLPEATAQQVFDQVATHMLTQKVKSRDQHGCKYKVGELKCAAGCLIGDDEYTHAMDNLADGQNWNSLVEQGLVPPHPTEPLIYHLQLIHDSCLTQDWAKSLHEVAIVYDLDPSILATVQEEVDHAESSL